MVLLEFAMYPLGQGESLSRYVARSLDIIDKSGLAYRLTPMGTILEGEWAEVMAVVSHQRSCGCSRRLNTNTASLDMDYCDDNESKR